MPLRMETQTNSFPLNGIRIVSLCINTPGPVAASRLQRLGARVIKVEPPAGDPLKIFAPEWYQSLAMGQTVITLDLKDSGARAELDELLAHTDLLLTSFRPSALRRLGLDWDSVHSRHSKLCFAGIIGDPHPLEEKSGHDLTYLAYSRLLTPPQLPATLFADLAGAERCVSQALALLLRLARTGEAGCEFISLGECARELSAPIAAGLTARGKLLGGGSPFYGLYQAKDGWIALAALEPRFAEKLLQEFKLPPGADHEEFARIFRQRNALAWEEWASERDIPVVAVH
jgi:alpha-methylacyl-CoA racemase